MENSREEKLAAAKKKLQKYQKSNRESTLCKNNNGIIMSNKQLSQFSEMKHLDETHTRRDCDVVVDMLSVNSLSTIQDNKNYNSQSVTLSMEANDGMYSLLLKNEESFVDDEGDVTLVNDTPTTAATETLLNLSRQMNGLITEPDKKRDIRQEIFELEQRNVELAEKLQKYAMMNENLSQQLTRMRDITTRLQKEKNCSEENKMELAMLHKQLTHLQDMISTLTVEKSELQMQLQASLQLAEQRRIYLASATERVKQTEAKLMDLEAAEQQRHQLAERLELQRVHHASELRSLRDELNRAQIIRNEVLDKNHDMQAALQAKCAECAVALRQVDELHRQVELAQLHANQVAVVADIRSKEQMEFIEKLEAERGQLTERVALLTEERKRLAQSSRALADQQQQQVARLREENDLLGREKAQLVTRLTELQDMETRRLHAIADQADLSRDWQILEDRLQHVQLALKDAEDRATNATANVVVLGRQASEATLRAASLEVELAQLCNQRDQLLDEIQLNQVALAEALARNDSLKEELFELQNASMTPSNRNSLMTLNLEQERELALQLKQQQQRDESCIDGDACEPAAHLPIRRHSDTVLQCLSAKEQRKLMCSVPNAADYVQLEYERNVLLTELADSRQKTEEFVNHVALMEQLETRFNRCMRSLAESEEENDVLRHKILQLEGETECIGEYAALYQQQRAVLQQREKTQEVYIARLSEERAQLHAKLVQVQSILVRLFNERNQDDMMMSVEDLCETKQLLDIEKDDALCLPQPSPSGSNAHEPAAQRILNLLSEIDVTTSSSTSDVVSQSTSDSRTYLLMTSGPCKFCTGRLLVV